MASNEKGYYSSRPILHINTDKKLDAAIERKPRTRSALWHCPRASSRFAAASLPAKHRPWRAPSRQRGHTRTATHRRTKQAREMEMHAHGRRGKTCALVTHSIYGGGAMLLMRSRNHHTATAVPNRDEDWVEQKRAACSAVQPLLRKHRVASVCIVGARYAGNI